MVNIDFKNQESLISIIIPCYNCENNIKKTLNSVKNQTYKNIEVVLVNDGSTDSTDYIINKYLKDNKINAIYIQQENKGVSSARNKGLEVANGEYITFLDSDDIYNNRYIEMLYNNLVKYGVEVAYCCYSRNLDKIKETYAENFKFDIVKLDNYNLLNNFMYRKGPCGFFNYIYKKSIIQKYDIRFSLNLKYGEDLEFTWKYLTNCKNGIFINEDLYGYYDNPYSAVKNINWRFTDVLQAIINSEDYLKNNKNIFYKEFKEYMYDRTIWAITKDFAISKDNKLYYRFISEYDVRKSMSNISKNSNNLIIKLTAIIFLINPKTFLKIFSIYKNYKK